MFAKTLFVAAVAALATMAAAQDPIRKCTTSEALAISKISPDAAKACTTETLFKAVRPTGYPDDAQLAKMCASDNCKTFMAALVTEWKPETPCEFDFGSGSPIVNIQTVANDFTPNCARLAAGGQTTPAPPTPTTTTPTPTTPEPTTTAPPKPTPSVAPHC